MNYIRRCCHDKYKSNHIEYSDDDNDNNNEIIIHCEIKYCNEFYNKCTNGITCSDCLKEICNLCLNKLINGDYIDGEIYYCTDCIMKGLYDNNIVKCGSNKCNKYSSIKQHKCKKCKFISCHLCYEKYFDTRKLRSKCRKCSYFIKK